MQGSTFYVNFVVAWCVISQYDLSWAEAGPKA